MVRHPGVKWLLCALLWSVCLGADETGPRKVALLVGVNQYLKPGFRDLEFAEADVKAVAVELQKLGFSVTVLLGSGTGRQQATLANIEAAAADMVAPLGKRDLALVMLSGHGQTLRRPGATEDLDESYYCPVDARVNDAATQFSLSHLLDDLLAPNVGRKMVLVDACRDVPVDLTKGARNVKGIEGRVVALPEDTAIFFSCRAGQTSFERRELGHGLFSHCVLEGLRGQAVVDGEVSWSSLIAHVGRRMTQPDLTKYVPQNFAQVPIFAGAMPHTVLGIVDGGTKQTRPAPTVNAKPGLAPDAERQLQLEIEEFDLALRESTATARKFVEDRAARRLPAWQAAADAGSPIGMFFVGRCRLQGVGLSENPQAAVALFQQAADKGLAVAWNNLGAAYETGRGVAQDFTRAAECYRQGGELGSATAMLNLGYLYGTGQGVPKSKTKEFEWTLRAAEAGEVGCMRSVGRWYETGTGAQRDLQQARHWYERAAAAGNKSAMNDLGVMYSEGRGVGKDFKEAMRYFQMAAERGDAFAMNNVGARYHNGEGVEKDLNEAVRWYRKSWAALGTLSGEDYQNLLKTLRENFEAAGARP